VSRDVKGRELDIVCEPANALLVYNSRIGQFINGLTGRTPGGGKPLGFGARLPVWKGTWKSWREAHPQSRVMVLSGKGQAPGAPILPRDPVAQGTTKPASPVMLIATTQPVAMLSEEVSSAPSNIKAGDQPLVVFRDSATGMIRAFDRHVEADLTPRFVLNQDAKRKGAMVDLDTNTGWSASGVAVDGDKTMLGKKLLAVDVQSDVYWGVAKFWWPGLTMVKGEGAPEMVAHPATEPVKHATPVRKKKRR
jgi:hypothetical protein